MSELNVSTLFQKLTDSIENKAVELNDNMNELANQESIQPEQMLELQFEIGQYNALIEATSTMMKSLVDEAKQIAQRAN